MKTGFRTQIRTRRDFSPHRTVDESCLVVISGKKINQKFSLEFDRNTWQFAIGRQSKGNDIVIPDELVSRKHATLKVDKGRFILEDLNSSNGTLVNNQHISSPVQLKNQDKIQIGNTVLKFLQGDIESLFLETLREMTSKDFLTNVYNRNFLMEHLEHYFELYRRYKTDFSFIMFDVDRFKKINDTYGHQAGDKVLIRLCEVIGRRLRKVDIFARMGGEEFGVLLPETDKKKAANIADGMRRLIQDERVHVDDAQIEFTISLGVAAKSEGFGSISELIKRTDERLYQAKKNGRNCVIAM